MRNSRGQLRFFLILLLLVVGLEFLFLTSYAPFMHNHPLNQRETNDCPAFVIQTTLLSVSPFTLLIQLFVFAVLLFLLPLFEAHKPVSVHFSSQSPRSPPAFS